MNKEIKYSGYSAVPSDYECPDGTLDVFHNLINENGCLTPLLQPANINLKLNPGQKLIFVHNIPNLKNYIITQDIAPDGGEVALMFASGNELQTIKPFGSQSAPVSCHDITDITAIGNTIIIAHNGFIQYFLWKDDSYISLGSKPPIISIDLGSCLIGSLYDSAESQIADCPQWTAEYFSKTPGFIKAHVAKSPDDETAFNSITDAALGLLFSAIADSVTSKGYFFQPFFIRYAYRLYDGSYYWHSAPILLLPNVCLPFIKLDSSRLSDNVLNLGISLDVPYFKILYRILSPGIDGLKLWKDIIYGIDIFISQPIYTFNQAESVTGLISKRSLLTCGPCFDTTYGHDSFRGDNSTDQVFTGHYCDDPRTPDFTDHITDLSQVNNTLPVFSLPVNKNFNDSIRNVKSFYKFKSIDIDDLHSMTDFDTLVPDDKDLSNLVTRPTLSDDYQSHFNIIPGTLNAYNNRLNIAGLSLVQPPPFPLRCCSEYHGASINDQQYVKVTIWSRHDGSITSNSSSGISDQFIYPLSTGAFPRYIYYPDAAAYKMAIESNDKSFVIQLTPHDFLNGAYWYAGLGTSATPSLNTTPETQNADIIFHAKNKVYTSEVNNPFVFNPNCITSVGSGSVMALASAAKALSQGQFGQFPLYAFASDGIWALEVSATGAFSARQPLSRDVLLHNKAFAQLDSAVVFLSDRGIMLLSGSQITCLSDNINSQFPFSQTILPGGDDIMHDSGQLPPFDLFLSHCSIAYDYNHQRILFFRPDKAPILIYSLKSNLWSTAQLQLNSIVNDYPDTLANSSQLDILSLCADTKSPLLPGLIMSRPLKLDSPDVLKTIDTVIHRGNFRKGHVQSVLYGSRDLFSWHLVWSSKDHYLRGFRGTPYKYFRIALLCNLSPDESIFGASVQFTPRLTNQPR